MREIAKPNDHFAGLSQAEARRRLKRDGANELPTGGERDLFGIALEVVREPMFLLLVVAGVIYLLLGYALQQGATEDTARALTFATLVVGNLGLILVNRSWRHSILNILDIRNSAFWWVAGGAFGFLLLALSLPALRTIFHFAAITLQQFLLCLIAGLASVIWFELYKLLRRDPHA